MIVWEFVALVSSGHGAPYCEQKYGGYGPMFIKMLSDPGEEWDEYFVVEGHFPDPNELHKYDGFVVTGSRHDAHANEEWIEKLCGVLQQLHDMKKKSLCVCFGHQVLYRIHFTIRNLHKSSNLMKPSQFVLIQTPILFHV